MRNQTFEYLAEDLRVSILQFDTDHYELAIQVCMYPNLEPNKWELDYSVFNDVLTARSSMEVYGWLREIREGYAEAGLI